MLVVALVTFVMVILYSVAFSCSSCPSFLYSSTLMLRIHVKHGQRLDPIHNIVILLIYLNLTRLTCIIVFVGLVRKSFVKV